jgi:DeoR/GlpR family transcriptional regulator of sugar metabolism
MDEEKLLFGDNISTSIEATIKSETDYVLLFIDEYAVTSKWVAKEIAWTLEAEKSHGRTILLPVVIEDSALQQIGNIELLARRYVRVPDFSEASVRAVAASIASDLFALVCRDMELLRKPKQKNASVTLNDADALLNSQAALIRKASFPHRRTNPLTLDTLLNVINSQSQVAITLEELETILSSIVRCNLIPGLVYDGFSSLFLLEEHASWKAEIQHKKKEKVGRKAVALIQNGMKVILDAGSTVEEIVRPLCKRIESRAVTRITIATTSINIADMISDCCVRMGFDDDFSAVRLYVPGGQVRPNTQAIIPTDRASVGQIRSLADHLGGFDLAIIGTNGVDVVAGLTTNSNAEAQNKMNLAQASHRRIVVADSSKIGIVLDHKIADFDDDLQLVLDDDPASRELQSELGARGLKLVLA